MTTRKTNSNNNLLLRALEDVHNLALAQLPALTSAKVDGRQREKGGKREEALKGLMRPLRGPFKGLIRPLVAL